MEESAKTIVDKIWLLLRTFIPGCLVVAALLPTGILEPILSAARPKSAPTPSQVAPNPSVPAPAAVTAPSPTPAKPDDSEESRWTELSVISFLIGICLYSLHFLLLEHVVTWFIVRLVRTFSSNLLPPRIKEANTFLVMYWMMQERWSRPVAENHRARSHQEHLERHYAWMIFGYCVSYGAAFVGVLMSRAQNQNLEKYAPWAWGIGAGFLLGAFIVDYRVTYHEFWLAKNMPQNEDISPTSQSTISEPIQPAVVDPGAVRGSKP